VIQSIPHVRSAHKLTYRGCRSVVLACVVFRTDETFTIDDLGDWWARVQLVCHRAQA
jgi:hypothetical protein